MMQNKPGKRIGGGWTAQIYAWGNDRVLKLFEPWVPIEWINYEAKATQLAEKSGLPVPIIDGVIVHKQRHGIVMERIDGPTMLSSIFSRFWKTNYYARVLAKLQAEVNARQAPELVNLRSRLDRTIRNEAIIPNETKEAVLRVLEKLPDGESICHYDLHPMNIMMSSHGPVIIDWTGAGKGDAMADAARTWLLCTMPPIPMPAPITGMINAYLRYFYKAYLKEYNRLATVSPERLELWKIPVLAARLSEERTDTRKVLLLAELKKRLVKHI